MSQCHWECHSATGNVTVPLGMSQCHWECYSTCECHSACERHSATGNVTVPLGMLLHKSALFVTGCAELWPEGHCQEAWRVMHRDLCMIKKNLLNAILRELYPDKWPKTPSLGQVINRPGVAGAVLQSPLSIPET